MDFLKPALVFTALACAVLASSFFYVWLAYARRRYALLWGLSWATAVPHLACSWVLIGSPHAAAFQIADQLLLVANATLMVCGCHHFVYGRVPVRRMLLLAAPFTVWGILSPLSSAAFTGTQLPNALLLGGSYLWTAATFWNLHRTRKTRGTLLLAILFALGGLHEFDYPLFGNVAWAAPVGYAIASVLAMSIALNLLILILEESRIEVEHERARLHGVLDALPVGVLLLDAAGAVVLDNRAARGLMGESTLETPLTRERLAFRLLPPGEATTRDDVAEPTIIRSLGSGESFPPQEFALIDTLGERRAVLVNAGPMLDAKAKLLGVVTVIQDIEAFKQIERQAVRSQRLQALGTLAAGVAHNFNKNLALILGHAQLALKSSTHGPARVRLDAICQIATDSVGIVSRIQDLARDRHTDSAGATRFDLGALVHDVIELARPRWREGAGASGVRYEVESELARAIMLSGQPGDLREAILNLVLNALDAMPSGGRLRITVSAENSEACLRVCDEGEGIPPEIRERIFDPFFSTKGPRGTGLGLSFVFGVVERHAGRIAVQSEPGVGTVFTIHLPQTAAEELAEHAEPATSLVATAHVLVLDDDAAILAVTVEMLEAEGYRATPASSSELALRLMEDPRFDVLFTDLSMPGVTGWDIAAHAARVRPGLPVVLVTGSGRTISAADFAASGAVCILSKPYTLEELRAAVECAVRGNSIAA